MNWSELKYFVLVIWALLPSPTCQSAARNEGLIQNILKKSQIREELLGVARNYLQQMATPTELLGMKARMESHGDDRRILSAALQQATFFEPLLWMQSLSLEDGFIDALVRRIREMKNANFDGIIQEILSAKNDPKVFKALIEGTVNYGRLIERHSDLVAFLKFLTGGEPEKETNEDYEGELEASTDYQIPKPPPLKAPDSTKSRKPSRPSEACLDSLYGALRGTLLQMSPLHKGGKIPQKAELSKGLTYIPLGCLKDLMDWVSKNRSSTTKA